MLSVNNKGQLISQASSGNKLLLDFKRPLFQDNLGKKVPER